MATYSKILIATIQLERAISVLIEHEDYVSAITLAGAAEEMLGAMVITRGGESAYHSTESAFNYIYRHYFREEPPKGHFRELAVGTRNHLKHYSETDQVSFDAQMEAATLIGRAIDNFVKLMGSETELMKTFLARGEPQAVPFARA